MKKKIAVFTGAGVSKESGIPTYRDSMDSLWVKHNVDDCATVEGWNKDREKVLEFHHTLRKEMLKKEPNDAHKFIAELEKDFNVTVITQNIDVLHEAGGSKNVIHLHGRLDQSKSTVDPNLVYNLANDEKIEIGDKCEKESQLRYNTVLFGDPLPRKAFKSAASAMEEADILIIVGSSLQVYPAAGLIGNFKGEHIYVIDPGKVMLAPGEDKTFIVEPATRGMRWLKDKLTESSPKE